MDATDNLKRRVLSALRWTAAARFSAQFVTWTITLVVIRLLRPEDYGLMAMSEVFFSLLLLLSTRGLAAALIQAKEVTERQVRQLFGVLILTNSLLFLVLCAGAPWIADYYREPRVVAITRVLAIGFLVLPFFAIPQALLTREIDFKRRSIVELCASVISALTVLTLAALDYGVWALVVGKLVNFVLTAVGLQLVRPSLWFPIFSLRALGGLVRFGGLYTLSSLMWVIYQRAPVLIAGRFLSSTELGYYAVGAHLAALAVTKVMPLLNQIALPAYARVQDRPSAAGYYFLKVVRIAGLLSFPIFFGLAVVGPEFVRVVLGSKYEPAIVPLVLLCLAMPAQLLGNLFPAMIMGMGRPGVDFGNKAVGVVLMPAAYLLGIQWGVTGMCASMIGAGLVYLAVLIRRGAPLASLRAREILRAAAPGLAASLAMALLVLSFKRLGWAQQAGAAVELAALVLVGIVGYAVILRTFLRPQVRAAIASLRA